MVKLREVYEPDDYFEYENNNNNFASECRKSRRRCGLLIDIYKFQTVIGSPQSETLKYS